MPPYPLWEFALWGAFGGVAVEAIEILGALKRFKRVPWRVPGEITFAALTCSAVLRLGLGAGLALALGQASQIGGGIGAIAVGVSAPLILEQLGKQFAQTKGSIPSGPVDSRMLEKSATVAFHIEPDGTLVRVSSGETTPGAPAEEPDPPPDLMHRSTRVSDGIDDDFLPSPSPPAAPESAPLPAAIDSGERITGWVTLDGRPVEMSRETRAGLRGPLAPALAFAREVGYGLARSTRAFGGTEVLADRYFFRN